MKKTFKVLLNIFALFSLIACGSKSPKSEISQSSNSSIETTDKQQSSSEEEVSSSYEIITSISSNNADEEWSIEESSSLEETTSVEQSSILDDETSSGEEENTSSEQESSSSDSESSSLEDIYYHVIFVNYDNSVLYEIDVLESEEAIYHGSTPTREEDSQYSYEFIGWDIDLSVITSDVTAKAQYKSIAWSPVIWF